MDQQNNFCICVTKQFFGANQIFLSVFLLDQQNVFAGQIKLFCWINKIVLSAWWNNCWLEKLFFYLIKPNAVRWERIFFMFWVQIVIKNFVSLTKHCLGQENEAQKYNFVSPRKYLVDSTNYFYLNNKNFVGWSKDVQHNHIVEIAKHFSNYLYWFN